MSKSQYWVGISHLLVFVRWST